jgi:large subunit ribosomal protein LP0
MSDNEETTQVETEEKKGGGDGGVNPRRQRKLDYGQRLLRLIAEYKNILLLNIDNVGSRQMQQVRIALRGKAVFLMGKNTIIRRVLRDHIEAGGDKRLETMLPEIYGNVGFCFTNNDLSDIRKQITENQVPAAARGGAFAPLDVYIPPGATPLDPGQTAFFQALNIATKITRGAIEIINTVHLIKKGERVSASAVALLTKLAIKPFFFGIKCTHVYENGSFYRSEVLDLSQDLILGKFLRAASRVAAVSLAINVPSAASLPHSVARAFQKILGIGLVVNYIFKEAEPYKAFLDNPDAFRAAAGAGAASGGGAAPAAVVKAPEPEDDDDDVAPSADVDIFGGGDAGY